MFFPKFRRLPRRRHRSTQQIEHLEPRELLAAVAQLTSVEVTKLLDRASMATSNEDAIIAVVDRGGHILGVRVEQDVLDGIDADTANGGDNNGAIDNTAETNTLIYAIDGAVAKARTAAFFANGSIDSRVVPGEADLDLSSAIPTVGPLTSRTIRNISQSTITQREVQSNPSIADPDSTLRGPGFVAPISLGQHFPPEIPHTPQVDLFGIEHTNRDSIVHPGIDALKGTADDITLQQRFNIDPAFVPGGQVVDAPESYGFISGLNVDAQARGIATLPGGLPIFRGLLSVVGGIGVFFPGTSDPDGAGPGHIGDATFEQNFPNAKTETERLNAPKALEAEYTAFYAIGGGLFGGLTLARDRIDGGDFPIPFGRIDLVGITLQIIGPTTGVSGVRTIEAIGDQIPQGDVKLAVKVNSTATSITVNDASGLPATPFTVLIEKEVLKVTAVSGNVLTVERAPIGSGTVAKSHAAGKAVIAGTVQLAAAINDSTTSITVTDASVLPTAPFTIRIEKEVLNVTAVSGNTLTVARAQGGSKAARHAVGKQLITSSGQDQFVKATSSVLTALTDTATSLVVPDASVFPATPFSITIDNEEILVTGITATPDFVAPDFMILPDTLTIVRAQNGTLAAPHAIGATIRTTGTSTTAVAGRAVPEGWLVTPHDSPTGSLTAADVRDIIEKGIIVAGDQETQLGLTSDGRRVRAAIRLKVKGVDLATFDATSQKDVRRVGTVPGTSVSMVLAVGDELGNVLGLYRMHDSTIFSIDVAVAKARNTAYYANATEIQDIDRVDDNQDGVPDASVPAGTAFTNRTFRFLAEPRFPQGVDGSKPGAFSILNEKDPITGDPVFQTEFLKSKNHPKSAVQAVLNNGGPAKASVFQTVFGYDSFNPGTNFRISDYIAGLGLDPASAEFRNLVANQNGIVFFPGSTPLYGGPGGTALIGGYGISGDGVDQDDVVTYYGAIDFLPPDAISTADEVRVRNTRLPYQKFNRNPFG